MSEQTFDLVFKGQLAKGVELATAKRNIAQLFKINSAKVDALFSGKGVVLKRSLSADAANKYRVAIKKAGALVDVVVSRPAQTRGKASFGEQAPQPEVAKPVSMSPGAIPGTIPGTAGPASATNTAPASGAQTASGPAAAQQPRFTLAPVGADLLESGEKKEQPLVQVDTSGLSLRENSGKLLDDSEYTSAPQLAVDVSEFELDEAGADVLRPEERKQVTPVQVNTDDLSVGEPGVNLAPPKPAPPAAPDTSSLSLQE